MLQGINLLAPYQTSAKYIAEYESKCKNRFDWLGEVVEEVRKTLSLPEKFLLPKTPCQNRKRQRCALPAISENQETAESPILKKPCIIKNVQDSSSQYPVASDNDNCSSVRQSKRIASQKASETENNCQRKTRRQLRLELEKGQDGTSLKAAGSIQVTSELQKECSEAVDSNIESKDETKKQTVANNYVPASPALYKTRSKKILSENIVKAFEVMEKKEIKRTKTKDSFETPIKTTCNKFIATTPSVKNRVQAYEESIKLVNTPGVSKCSNTYFSGSPKKKLIKDSTQNTETTTHSDRSKSPSQQNVTCAILTKRLSRLSQTHRRTSIVHYQMMACKIKTKRSSTASQRRSKRFSAKNRTSNQNKSGEPTTSNNSRKSQPSLTPVVVLEKMENSFVEENVTGKSSLKDDDSYSDISTPTSSVPVTPVTAPANKLRKLEVSSLPKIGKTSTPCVSAASTGKLHQNFISRISKVPRTPQQGMSYLNQSSILSRVLSLREHVAPKDREKHLQEEMKKRQKRENEVLRKKENLLKAKIEEQKRKREERMRKVSETRQRLLKEKDHKRILELTKEERAAQKGAELKEKKRQIIQIKQMTRRQKLAEVEERRKKEEEIRLQKLKEQKEIQELEKQKLQLAKGKQKVLQIHNTPVSQTSIHKKAIYNNYLSKANKEKDTLVSTEEKENEPQKIHQILNTTYEKKENNPESYEMTPARSKVPSPSDSADNYGISDIKSDDETDDESAPKKTVPAWAQGMLLRTSLLQQACNPPDVNTIFGNFEPPDLTEIFAIQRKRFQKRTSSAVWPSRSFLTP